MNNLLILGCSFSALDYHDKFGNITDSYTFHIKNELNSKNLINLAVHGASPSTINRILLQYIDNPKFGIPDFVFIQWPYPNRNEYFTDSLETYQEEIYTKLNVSGHDGLIVAIKRKNHHEVDVLDEKDYLKISNGQWKSTSSDSDVGRKELDAHRRLYHQVSQQMINLYKEVGIAEQYLGNLRIPYAYVESDVSHYPSRLLATTDFNDSILKNTYKYARLLCHKRFFIPNVGVEPQSPTYANDDYPDKHPGPISHRQFADAMIPKLKELINEK